MMRFENPNCPKCGNPAGGILEEYVARTPLAPPDETGDFDFAGGTRIDYDSGFPVEDDEGVHLLCDGCQSVWTSQYAPEEGSAVA